MKTHKDLDVWKKSIEFAQELYTVTGSFPKEEIFGLTNQLRRAAVSIPSNIAEGAARQTRKEFIQFLHIALGSSAEVETQLILAEKLKLTTADLSTLNKALNEIILMLTGLIRSLRRSDE